MREMFGPQKVNWWKENQEKIEIIAEQNTAILDPETLVRVREGEGEREREGEREGEGERGREGGREGVYCSSLSLPLSTSQAVQCEDESLNHLVTMATKRLHTSLFN